MLRPEDINERDASGDWVKVPDEITPTRGGFEISAKTYTVSFPAELSERTPVIHTTEAGSVSQVPEGTQPSKAALERDGTLRYTDVRTSTDLLYSPAAGGFKLNTNLTREAGRALSESGSLVMAVACPSLADSGAATHSLTEQVRCN